MTTVEAVNGQPVGLIEAGIRALSASRARRKERGGSGVLGRALGVVGELLGTVLALAAFVVAAFLIGFALGFLVAGVCLLLLDFKVSLVRRARATGRRQR